MNRLRTFFFLVLTIVSLCLSGCADYPVNSQPVSLITDEWNSSGDDEGEADIVSPEPSGSDDTSGSLDNSDNEPEPDETPEPSGTPEPIAVSTEEFGLPNELGRVLIIMYHGITEDEPPTSYQRSQADFKADLLALYERGYRLVSVSDIALGKIDIPRGYSPVAITFDDGLASEFSLVETEEGLVCDPNSGIGILDEFCRVYPDFGKGATLYVNKNPFPGEGTMTERFSYLLENGHDIGNHSATHPQMNKLGANEIQAEYAEIDRFIQENALGYAPLGIAYPYGSRPIEELRYLQQSGQSDGHSYEYFYGLAVGQNGNSAAFYHTRFDPMNLPRVRASDDDPTDLWAMIRQMDERPELRYISDGDINTLTIPAGFEEVLNREVLDIELIILK